MRKIAHTLLASALLTLVLAGCGNNGTGTAVQTKEPAATVQTERTAGGGMMTTVNVETIANLIGQDSVRIIDVRTPEEYAEGHLQGAENIDVKAADFDEKTKDITGAVVVYCRSGRRSREAGLKLAGNNCLVLNMDGGILAWQKAGMPVTKE